MKISVVAAIVLLGVASVAHAQYGGDPNSSYIDQMVRDHIDLRRAEQRRRSTSKTSSGRKGSQRSSGAATSRKAKAAKASPLGELSLGQDMYSSFGDSDARGFTLEVRLAPASQSGKPLVRWARFAPSKGDRSVRIGSVPSGRYEVSARVIDADKKVTPVQLGTQCGEPTNPNGGNFAATQLMEMVAGKDIYGKPNVLQKTVLWFRPR